MRAIRLAGAALLVCAAASALAVVMQQAQPRSPSQHIEIHVIGPRYTLQELVSDADLIVLAEAVEQTARWNSTDNRPWTPAPNDDNANTALIYSDTRLVVIGVLKGDHEDSAIYVRTAGGVIGDIRMTVGDAPDLKVGAQYVLLLDRVQTPIEDGSSEEAWAPVALGQGIFFADVGGFRNTMGELAEVGDFAR